MQSERVTDQAEGLRKLLVRTATRVITVAGAQSGFGVSSLVISLANILVRDGGKVLMLDENLSHNNIGNMLALRPRHDLLHVVRGDKLLREALLHPAYGISVLPVARAMQALPKLSMAEREILLENLAKAAQGMDVVLVDAALRDGRIITSRFGADQPLLLVINASASALTESYALIKRMAQQVGVRCFQIVVNKVQGADEACRIFDNLDDVARQHLNVRLDYIGHVPFDMRVQRALQSRLPAVEIDSASITGLAIHEIAANLIKSAATLNIDKGELLYGNTSLKQQIRLPDTVAAI